MIREKRKKVAVTQMGRNMQPSVNSDREKAPLPGVRTVRLVDFDDEGVPVLDPLMGSQVGIVLVGCEEFKNLGSFVIWFTNKFLTSSHPTSFHLQVTLLPISFLIEIS